MDKDMFWCAVYLYWHSYEPNVKTKNTWFNITTLSN